jgi:hypothetical protein
MFLSSLLPANTRYPTFIICFAFLLLVLAAVANSQPAQVEAPKQLIVDSIEIENNNIFDLNDPNNGNWIFRLANKLHFTTRKSVIERELLMGRGDFYSRKLADETERNLRWLPYIFDARVYLDSAGEKNILKVTTSDRWTLAGGPTFSRSSGQIIYQLGLEELNFLGYGQQIMFNHFIREFEQNYSEFSFYDRRLFGLRNSFSLYYNGHPEIGAKTILFSRPFYSRDANIGYQFSFSDIDRLERYFISGIKISRNRYRGQMLGAGLHYRFGTYQNKVSLGMTFNYRDIEISDRNSFYSNISVTFPADSSYFGFSPVLDVSRTEYIQTKRINSFSMIEDFSLRQGAAVSTGWFYDADTRDILYRSISFSFDYDIHSGFNLLMLDFARTHWFMSNIDIRKKTGIALRYYNNYFNFMTTSLLISYQLDSRGDNRLALSVGEDNGLRGFPRDYVTGEELIRLNFENRLFTGIRFMSIYIGLVQFIDAAQSDGPGELRDFGKILWSTGAGVRIGTEKISNAELIRLDVAYAQRLNSWQLSFGVGQYF